MNTERSKSERESGTSALLILAFIALLVWKAMGNDISWGVVTAPIWGRVLYFVIIEALGLDKEK